MGFCPYYDKQCPQDTECEVWDGFGCPAKSRPGIPAILGGVNVYIIHIQYGDPKIPKDEVVVYANAETGVIGESSDMTAFTIYIP